jgi:hypothetical protein
MWGLVTTLELIQHPLAKTGHRKILLVTQTLTAQLQLPPPMQQPPRQRLRSNALLVSCGGFQRRSAQDCGDESTVVGRCTQSLTR